ncbi:MAG: MBL fold metallo-hydrolase [Acidobacteria bacterium]|nr:MBL fold metallo-hydrolase [Acidobacteriota bacterium]
MTQVDEVAADLFRIATYIPDVDLQFVQFLVRDDEPLLFHTGMRALFPMVHEAVSRLVDPAGIRWIGFSHFEADECGALGEWQAAAPQATAICSLVAKMVSVDDVVARRPARPLADGETLTTGRYSFRFLQTPQVPHAWDAGMLFEETGRTLLCSDLFQQNGQTAARTTTEVVSRFRDMLRAYQEGPFAWYLPYASHTEATLQRLADLRPNILATMHGATYEGDGAQAIQDLAAVMREVLGRP